MLTKKGKKRYLKEPSLCPFCGEGNIEGDQLEVDGAYAWQQVHCTDCQATWNDIYKLVDVEEA